MYVTKIEFMADVVIVYRWARVRVDVLWRVGSFRAC